MARAGGCPTVMARVAAQMRESWSGWEIEGDAGEEGRERGIECHQRWLRKCSWPELFGGLVAGLCAFRVR